MTAASARSGVQNSQRSTVGQNELEIAVEACHDVTHVAQEVSVARQAGGAHINGELVALALRQRAWLQRLYSEVFPMMVLGALLGTCGEKSCGAPRDHWFVLVELGSTLSSRG